MSMATIPEHHSPLREDVSFAAVTTRKDNRKGFSAAEESDSCSISSTAAVAELKFDSHQKTNGNGNTLSGRKISSSVEGPFDVPGASPILPESAETGEPSTVVPAWKYPTNMKLASKDVLQSLFADAIQAGESSDQAQLSLYGIYSFADVFLPAICHQHNAALKKIQSILQRDEPERAREIIAMRKFLYETTRMAQKTVRNAAQHRLGVIEPQLEQERTAAKEREDRDNKEKEKLQRLKQQKELKKQYPPNKEMWKELACLVPLLTKLEKEEKVWQEAKQEMEGYKISATSNLQAFVHEMDDAMDVDDDHDENHPPGNYSATVMERVEEMKISTTRVDQGLDIVDKAIQSSDALLRQVVGSHQHTQFHSRTGFGNASSKDLVRIMSQEGEDPI